MPVDPVASGQYCRDRTRVDLRGRRHTRAVDLPDSVRPVGLARRLAALVVVALALAPAAAAQPFQLTSTGGEPDVAVDTAGTAHVVWNQPSGEGADSSVYCQLPRGATTCSRFHNLIPAGMKGDSAGPRVILAPDGRIVVVTSRCCNEELWRFVSDDGGQTFDSRLVGDFRPTLRWQAAFGPGEHISVASHGEYQAAPLGGTATGMAELFPPSIQGTALTMLGANTPLIVASTTGERDQLGWRRYVGSGDPNSPSNWSPAQPIGPGAEPHLVSGPKGTFLIYEAGTDHNAPYVMRRWNGAGFDPPMSTVVAAGGSQRRPTFDQDATGTFHAVYGSNETMPQRLLYSRSADGVSWTPPREIAPFKEPGYLNMEVAAAGPDDGLAVSDENDTAGVVEAAPLSPRPQDPERPDDPSCRTRAEFRPVQVLLPEGCFKQVGGRLETASNVKVNGLLIEPRAGSKVVIDQAKRRIYSKGVTTARAGIIPVQVGVLDWTIKDEPKVRVDEFDLGDAGGKVFGFPLTGNGEVDFDQGTTTIAAHVGLPKFLGGVTGDITLRTDNQKGLRLDGLVIKVPSALIGPVQVKDLVLTYLAAGSVWQGSATLLLPPSPPGPRLDAAIGFREGGFDYGRGEYTFTSPGLALGAGVFLNKIRFAVNVQPPPTRIAGGVTLSAGPTVAGQKALGIDGDIVYTFPNPPDPAVLRADGTATLASIPFLKAFAEYRSSGYFEFGADLDYFWVKDVLGLRVGVNGWFTSSAFNIDGKGTVCVGFCFDAEAVLSSEGIAACGRIEAWGTDVALGFGYKWGGGLSVMLLSCDVGPFRAIKPAQAVGHDFTLPAGLPVATVAFRGSTGPPKVTLEGPGGERVVTPPEPDGKVLDDRFLLFQNPDDRTTYVAINKPSGGRWRVKTDGGGLAAPRIEVESAQSSTLEQVQVAHGLPEPSVKAKVGGKGHKRTLTYSVRQIAGQRVTFEERGGDVGRRIGTAKGKRGTIRFTPGAGRRGKRQIVALVESNGLPRENITVSSYKAPAPAKPARPGGLKLKRKGSKLTVTWRSASRAARYLVRATLPDGRKLLLFATSKKRRVRIKGVGKGDRVTVSVAGLRPDGMPGPAAKLKKARLR